MVVIQYSVCPCRYGGQCSCYTIMCMPLQIWKIPKLLYHTVYVLADMEDTVAIIP